MLATTINNNPKKAKDFDAVAAVAACHGYNVDGEIENGYIYATRNHKKFKNLSLAFLREI